MFACIYFLLSGTAGLYRAPLVWRDFLIEESTGITTAEVDDSPVVSQKYYGLNGKETIYPQQGQMYIEKELHQSGQTTERKVVFDKY